MAVSDINKRDRLALVQVGGLAVQAYSDPQFYRPTNDLDLMCSVTLSPSEFREGIGKDIGDSLERKGYETEKRKARYGYEIRSSEEGSSFYVHVSKFSPAYLERHGHWKSREFEQAKLRPMPEIGGTPVLVHRIEDIMANKARRLGNLTSKGYVFGPNLEEWESFLEGDLEKLGAQNLQARLKGVLESRDRLLYVGPENFQENITMVGQHKVLKDLYDLAILSRAISEGEEFDREYLTNALSTIPSIDSN